MILVIRISGLVENTQEVEDALFRMRLRRKYSAVLIQPTKDNLRLLQKVRNFVAYGTINSSTLLDLLTKRAVPLSNKKIDFKLIAEQIGKKDLDELGIKPFFRLHPPRGGIKSKIHFPKGVLGDNGDKINDLLRRML